MTQLDTPPLDQAAAEAFADRTIEILSDASLALLTSVGDQVGLFDTLADLPPSTSAVIAAAAGLHERYVREWLGGLTTGGIVEYDHASATYWLPAERAASLTTAAGPDNLAHLMQFVTMLARVEQSVVACFRDGGGVPYDEYETFHRVMRDDSAAVFDAILLDTVVPLAPELPDRLEAGVDIADIGCGGGHALNLLARAYPASRFVGYDFSEEAIEIARREADAWGLDNVHFEVQDVTELDQPGSFDLVTAFDAIHDQAQPAEVLRRVAAALRPGGVFLMIDIRASSDLEANRELPWAPFLYALSTMHCMTVSLSLDGEGLGTVWGEQRATRMLGDAGFSDVRIEHLEGDPFNSYYVARLD